MRKQTKNSFYVSHQQIQLTPVEEPAWPDTQSREICTTGSINKMENFFLITRNK